MSHREISLQTAIIPLASLMFVVSGFAALIYQSVWSSYLGLLLGHAAYSQALVLSMFMGGMAAGAWLASRIPGDVRKLVGIYALVEAFIGLLGLLFHGQYLVASDWLLTSMLPSINSALAGVSLQWGTGALLVLPQSVLLGMTFPLLGAACIKRAEAADPSVLGTLYFSNSIGAVFGALVASFYFVPSMGTPGALKVAGFLNLLVAVTAAGSLVLTRRVSAGSETESIATHQPNDSNASQSPASPSDQRLPQAMFWAAGLTGATSFVYEIGWIRQLNLALGSTVHSFELMLSAFILGIALGGLTVRWAARRWQIDPTYGSALALVGKGIATTASLIMFAQSFDFVEWLLQASNRTDPGYTLYLFGTALWALLTVSPAAFFAGMTLPWMTAAVIRRGYGTDQIGKVYAANTFGAICGVYLALHVLIPLMGVRLSLIVAAVVDVAVGIALMRKFMTSGSRILAPVCLSAMAVSTLLAQTIGQVSVETMTSGVFRIGRSDLPEGVTVPFYEDGKTATVSIVASPDSSLGIMTNGKSDAGVMIDPAGRREGDEITMVMAAALPMSGRNDLRDIAVVGFGSGISTHVALANPKVRSVDTIEIEPVMVDAARIFGGYNARAYSDPRSNIIINDARTQFATGRKSYDLIVSEPSNPWVSGVASLFTIEYYSEVKSYLRPDGLFVQWLQAYELDDALLTTMMAALDHVFERIDVYTTNGTDLLLVARGNDTPFSLAHDQLESDDLVAEAGARGIGGPNGIQVRRILDGDGVKAYVHLLGAEPHSDFFPVVAHRGPAARFKNASPTVVRTLVDLPLPWAQMAFGREEWDEGELAKWRPQQGAYPFVLSAKAAFLMRDALRDGSINPELSRNRPKPSAELSELMQFSGQCPTGEALAIWIDRYVSLLVAVAPYLSPADADLFTTPRSLISNCDSPDPEQVKWLVLGRSMLLRDARSIEQLSTDLLKNGAATQVEARHYLVAALELARLAQGKHAGVKAAQSEFSTPIPAHSPLLTISMLTRSLADVRAEAQAHRPPQ
jgi:spermidine synthase